MNNIYLMDDALLLRRLRRRRLQRKQPIRQLFVKREQCGEFHHIMEDLNDDPIMFRGYFRMQKETFEDILRTVEPHLLKASNFPRPISPAERLVVTLR